MAKAMLMTHLAMAVLEKAMGKAMLTDQHHVPLAPMKTTNATTAVLFLGVTSRHVEHVALHSSPTSSLAFRILEPRVGNEQIITPPLQMP